ncbi:MAG: hypothetical protein HQ477_09155 [Chloroflexi bacterium]|nr:hypothetical protein [Chloroflexota bacterium]
MSALTNLQRCHPSDFTRLTENPIIRPNMDDRMGDNVNGPSLTRVPSWVARPFGKYYLYFGHHDGDYIRLVYADEIAGPWQIHAAGTLGLNNSHFNGHIASPHVHVDEYLRQIRMYFHGRIRVVVSEEFTRPALQRQSTGSISPQIQNLLETRTGGCSNGTAIATRSACREYSTDLSTGSPNSKWDLPCLMRTCGILR